MRLLKVDALVTGYEGIPVVRGVDLSVSAGQVVSVIGANGAGKTTLLRALSGLNRVYSGEVTLGDVDLTNRSPAAIAASGLAHVPENRRVFPAYPVEDNLRLGAYVRRREGAEVRKGIADIYQRFPVLGERRRQLAGSLSGGEQQVLAIAMALVARPQVLMLDEPSLGLAPLIVRQVFDVIRELKESGMTILLVEQRAGLALGAADRGVVLQLGRVVASGSVEELRRDDLLRKAYLGGEGPG
jgi:branched-chain amino acid transport system ATP-binding protein